MRSAPRAVIPHAARRRFGHEGGPGRMASHVSRPRARPGRDQPRNPGRQRPLSYGSEPFNLATEVSVS
jgi:hypothetical protein